MKSKRSGGILRFVDIDETVFHTTAEVKIRSAQDGTLLTSLTNQQWNTYPRDNIRAKIEYPDFSDFADSEKFYHQSRPIEPMIENLRQWSFQMKTDPKHFDDMVVFVTARGDFDNREKFLDTFRQQRIHVDDKDHFYVSRTGNLSDDARINGIPLSTAQRKKIEFLHYMISKMPETVELYEDSEKNIDDFLALKKEMPYMNYRAFLVKADQVREVKNIKEK